MEPVNRAPRRSPGKPLGLLAFAAILRSLFLSLLLLHSYEYPFFPSQSSYRSNFPSGGRARRPPGFSRIEGSVLVHLKPLVRYKRARNLSPAFSSSSPYPPPSPAPFAATTTLLSIHSRLPDRKGYFLCGCVESLKPSLEPIGRHYGDIYGCLYVQGDLDCRKQ